jgi:hypothetical protein
MSNAVGKRQERRQCPGIPVVYVVIVRISHIDLPQPGLYSSNGEVKQAVDTTL